MAKNKSVRTSNGYRLLYRPDHRSCMIGGNWDGYVYEHIYVIEKSIGRSLEKDEVVHHLDCNRSNNRLDNLLLLSSGMHIKLHAWIAKGAYIDESYIRNGINSGKPKDRQIKTCEVCGDTLQYKQKRTCSRKCWLEVLNSRPIVKTNPDGSAERIQRPTRSELVADINSSMPIEAIGRKYGVTGNAVRKWMRKFDVQRQS